MRISHLALVAIFAWSGAAACGYSNEEHDEIWKARLLAAKFADVKATALCDWKPESQITFADDIEPDASIQDRDLFFMVSNMIRRDQNALAIHNSFNGDARFEFIKSKLNEVNTENLRIMKRYFSDKDFPGVDAIGENGVNALLLLVAHADADLEFQKEVLSKMNAGVKKGNLPQYLPLILESIRPQIIESDDGSIKSATAPSSGIDFKTPRQCYYGSHSRFINEYLRENYKATPPTTTPRF